MTLRVVFSVLVLALVVGFVPARHASATATKSKDRGSFLAHDHASLGAMFKRFKAEHKRVYPTRSEENKSFDAFVRHMKRAAQEQARNPLASFGVTVFADLFDEEFTARFGSSRRARIAKKPDSSRPLFSDKEVRSAMNVAIDWRTRGAVTSVKNQGNCGSDWAFSAVGNIEGQWFLANNSLVSLSAEELVSCDMVDNGCQGGGMDSAFNWIINSNGGSIVTDEAYPYTSGNGSAPQCATPSGAPAAVITSYFDLPSNESQMARWLLTDGPISVAVDPTSWKSYKGGIVTNCVSENPTLGSLIVGFNDTHQPPFWILKTSFGTGFGMSGYVLVAKGSNQCLIASAPSSSVVSGGTTTPTPVTPSPPPPPPTPQPSPTPPPAKFTQYVCTDWACSEGCTSNQYSQDQCLQTTNGVSVIAKCVPGSLRLTVFGTSDCKGTSTVQSEPLNQCLPAAGGGYLKDVCGSSSEFGGKGASEIGTALRLTTALTRNITMRAH